MVANIDLIVENQTENLSISDSNRFRRYPSPHDIAQLIRHKPELPLPSPVISTVVNRAPGHAVVDDGHFGTSQHHALISKMTAWLKLFVGTGEAAELRALDYVERPGLRPGTASGFFDTDHLELMAQEALRVSQTAKGVYFTLNPLNPDLLSRRNNRLDIARDDLAADKDVVVRRWLLVDVDPCRIAGVSASAIEKDKALTKIGQTRDFLRERGWPDPVFADSGNGYHLLYRVDLPTADGELVKRVLHALGDRFDDDSVKVDRAVFNPARIVKLYGTLARKGDSTPQRPHRWSSILEIPVILTAVSVELLQDLADEVHQPTKHPDSSPTPATEPTVRASLYSGDLQQRARSLLANLPGAVAGDHGHDRTFRAACLLVKGLGLPVNEAMQPLKEWNARCQPPWDEKHLRHKLEDAAKADGPVGYLLRKNKPQKHPGLKFKAKFMDCGTLDSETIQLRWLVKKVLVAEQPMVVGGPKKALKTSIVTDLAISLATGKPFLNKFEIPAPVKVVFLSGESGMATQQDTARRVCKAKGVEFRDCNIAWGFELPKLSNDGDLAELTIGLAEAGAQVVIIDPLYLCLLDGNTDAQASNMYKMGPLLLKVSDACRRAGATPILVHHARKENQMYRGNRNEPLDLEDLAFAGIAEFARQWMIVSRNGKFDPDTGQSKLWLNVGGSAGHSGLYGLEVTEGMMTDDFGGRRWEVYVVPPEQAIKDAREKKEQQKAIVKNQKELDDREQIIKVLRHHAGGETQEALADETGIDKRRIGKLLHGLLEDLVVCRCWLTKHFGGNARKTHKAWKLYREPGKIQVTNQKLDGLIRQGVCLEDAMAELRSHQDGGESDEQSTQDTEGASNPRCEQNVLVPGARTNHSKRQR